MACFLFVFYYRLLAVPQSRHEFEGAPLLFCRVRVVVVKRLRGRKARENKMRKVLMSLILMPMMVLAGGNVRLENYHWSDSSNVTQVRGVLHISAGGSLHLVVNGAGTLTFKAQGSFDGFYYFFDKPGDSGGYIRNSGEFTTYKLNIPEGLHTVMWITYDKGYIVNEAWGEVSDITWNGETVKYDTNTQEVDGVVWTYTVADGKASVGDRPWSSAPAVPKTTTGAIAIPSTLGGCPVMCIGDYAFSGCSALTSVTIPASVTSIGEGAFDGCSGVKEYIVEEGNQNYKVISGLLMTKDGKTLIASVNGARIVLSSVTAQQRYPWNGKVDITVVIHGTEADVAQYDCVFAATNSATKAAIPIDHITQNGDDVGAEGVWTRKFIWDAAEDVGEVTVENVELTVDAKPKGVQLWENGPYWAECNVGASQPEECGYYFWWGDTVGYKRNSANNGWVSVKDGSSFSFSSGNCQTYGKNNSQLQSMGYIDVAGNLVAKYDAATAHLGASLRMPTSAEWGELINNCTTTWTTRNGVKGRLVTGKDAYASKSIFFPAAGYGDTSNFDGFGSYGDYWSSMSSDNVNNACGLNFDSGNFYRYDGRRCLGRSVRPVQGFSKATTGVSSEFWLDTRTCARETKATETIAYSSTWEVDDVNAVVEVAVDGVVIKSASGTGVVDWTPIQNGTYLLTHKVKVAGEQVGETLSATFIVTGLNPENPVIEPASGTVFADTLSISMTCASEDATIYYTTDGSEPTKESMVYSRRFRIFDKTTIRARAFYENGDGSDVVTAYYALGQCPDPVIVTEGGETFLHKDNQISIDWECEDGILRYTIDGSDVTETSSEYIRPFMIDDTTVIKAKAFGETYFDSEQVELTATRDWEAVATPNIVAAETFSGTKTMVSISCETEGATIRYTINGSEPNAHSRRYAGSFEVRETTIVKAYATLNDYADSAVATKTIAKVWVIGDSVGLPDHAFTTDGDAQWVNDGGAAMKSGKITHNQTTSMKSTFIGKGKLSFELRTSCEEDDPAYMEYDHAEFLVNGELKLKRDGVHDWEVYEYDFDEGEHSVEWKYVKDTIDDAKYPGEDCIWVRKIVWLPELTCTTEVPVKLSWIREKFGDLGNYYYDYEEKAKETAQNGHKVWECYVAGEEPKDPLSKFTAIITVVDGKPIISWTPEVKDESGRYLRKYTVYGKAKLVDEQWEVVPEGCEGDYNFFKVTVEML